MSNLANSPEHWVSSTIGEIFEAVGGGTPSTEREEFWKGHIPWITSADIDELGHITPRRSITEIAIDSSATNKVPAGSVVVVTRVGLGKVGVAETDLCFSQDCQALLFDRKLIDPKFVAQQMSVATRRFHHVARGTTINGVTKKELRDTPFLLPPISEQRRITEKIEELFSDLDSGITALERARANLKRYRAAVLKAAIEGKLTEQWRKAHPDVEPASKLLERILAERRRKWEEAQLAKYTASGKTPPKGWKEKYPGPVAPDTNALSELPKGWCWTSIDHLVAQKNNSLRRGPFGSTIKKEYFVPDGYKVYEQQHAIQDNFELGNYFITEEKYRELSSFWLLPGDVIISCSGTIGRVAVVPSNVRPGVINQALLKITLDPDVILVNYFRHVFASRLRDLSVRGTGMNNFSGIEELKKMAFPLPCLDEQREVCAHLLEVESAIDRVEGQIATEMLRTRRLRQSILKRAFEGKLVPQDPNDEPASVLLERIRAARAAEGPKSSSRLWRQGRKQPSVE